MERFQNTLRNSAQEDPTVKIKIEILGGQTTISGMSELQLAGIYDQISHEFNIQIDVHQPEVIYLETVLRLKRYAELSFVNDDNGI